MNDKHFSKLKSVISSSRLSTYDNTLSLSADKLIGRYVWNVKLSENFYFLLQNLEVSLRNSIYNAYLLHYQNNHFFYLHQCNSRLRYQNRREFHSRECWKMLSGVNYKLNRLGVDMTDGKIISELNFGFWTEILSSNHTQYTNMWRKIFCDVFPNLPIKDSIDKTKIEVSSKINNIRKFRNRIFHYEPIFNTEDIIQIHDDILKVIGWIDIDLQKLTILFDEYHNIKENENDIVKKLSNFGENDK